MSTNADSRGGCCWRCCLPLRYVVVAFCLLGFTIDYLLKFSISVAIVAMVNNTHHANNTANRDQLCTAAVNASYNPVHATDEEFNWTLRENGIVLGTFFWGFLVTKTVGGRIAEVAGARETMCVSLGLSGVLNMLSPVAAQIHPLALAGVRLLMGIMQGPATPAFFCILARWALPTEVSTMIALTGSGMSLGALLALGVSGWVVDWLGWRWVFWASGISAIVWTLLCLLLVRNSPQQHPFISNKEKRLLSVITTQPRRRVPWGRLLRCGYIYLLLLAEFSNAWLQTFLVTETPSFFVNQIGMSLETSGWAFIALTCVVWIACPLYGWVSDILLRHQVLSKVNIRRVMQGTGAVISLVGSAGAVWAGCRKNVVGAMIILMGLGMGSSVSTFSLSPMDIAPNYVGTVTGLLGLSSVSGFLLPIVTSFLISLPNGWNINLLLTGGIYFFCSLVYIIGITADVQEWNYYENIPGEEEQPDTTKKRSE
ncbi:vesicular glutamate transporter 3-like [Panulirus ornatus]|uniref:vesicular glutamate transporter 3-like n=1 Tax=Panulirus ornatus TaxID=150431 RepID=UPI003A85B924